MNTYENWIFAGSMQAIREEGAKVVQGGIAVFYHEDEVYALDNRCPHLGFPLHMGSLCDGVLTCHWHHARFDLCGGGTLDPWADDASTHEVICEEDKIWVNPQSIETGKKQLKYKERLKQGLEQNIGIVIAKSVVGLMEMNIPAEDIAAVGIEYGTRVKNGWNPGLTILTAMTRILPKLDNYGQILALYHGLLQVARNSADQPERHMLSSLPSAQLSFERTTDWYRNSIEVRDTQGAERILRTAMESGSSTEQLSDMMLQAVTDHFYLNGGHTLDFHNKAFEALDFAAPDERERVLSSLVPLLASPTRSEELYPWQSPVDLVKPIQQASRSLDAEQDFGDEQSDINHEDALLKQLLTGDPQETIASLTQRLKRGESPSRLAQMIALAAAERICRFHVQNDFGDWIAVLHTFTYAHAVHEALRRSKHPLICRALFHGAASIYLDRFLNVPAAPQPKALDGVNPDHPDELLDLLDKRQQVDAAAAWVKGYLKANGDMAKLMNTLGYALLREDAEFHSFQLLEAVFTEYDEWLARSDAFAMRAKETLLIAAVRYLAAHAPTAREIPHTARIAWRLHKGDKLFE